MCTGTALVFFQKVGKIPVDIILLNIIFRSGIKASPLILIMRKEIPSQPWALLGFEDFIIEDSFPGKNSTTLIFFIRNQSIRN